MSRYIEKVEKLTLPVIPLRGLVAFPSIPINFELERDISKAACEAAQASDSYVLLLTQKEMLTEKPEQSDLYDVGCVARIKQSLKKPDGNIRVIAEGMCRGTVTAMYSDKKYLRADVLSKTMTPDLSVTDLRNEALISETMNTLEEMLHYLPNVSDDFITTAASIKNPGLLADFVASGILVRYQDKAEVLKMYDPSLRVQKLLIIMENEMKLLKTELEIHRKVKKAMDDNQRDYYLREQLHAIESELGIDEDSDEYTKKIAAAKLPDEVREKLEKEVLKLGKMQSGSPDSAVIRNYLDTCLEIPWNKRTRDRLDIEAARRILDADHDGLDKIKNRIIEYLAVKQLNPDLKNQILCLVGPPGVGKTSLAASIARAMKRKYVRVSLGGIRDESDIRGHRKTYVAAMPGRIITALTQCGSMNPVMLLDEVDKMCSDMHGDPSSALLEVLDGEQNKSFRDHFIELPVDLSDCMFIATANSLDTVPRPLIDRMEIIELSTYTPSEKLAIAKNHLLPKQLKRHGLSRRTMKVSDAAIGEIISGYTRESGVRNLEREIGALCRKVARVIVSEGRGSVSVDAPDIAGYLGSRKFIDDAVADRDYIGVTNGLAYTEVGGDMLKVEVLVVDGTGKTELTGTLGDVMKESARIAVTYIRSRCAEFGIAPDFYKTKDIHIHVPEGAVPKDGPSAGVTITTSLVSALSGIPVRHDIAMTGEITLTGRVLAIGGLREKSTAAYAMGIRRILIPRNNMRDIEELDKTVASEVTFVPCDTLDDVLSEALVRPEKTECVEKPDSFRKDTDFCTDVPPAKSAEQRIYGTV